MKFLVYNWPFAPQPLEEYRKKADLFNQCGEACARHGLRFGYHNYSSSYQLVDGIYPQDLLMDRTDPSLVVHQMDVYWVWRAKQDPTAWLKKYPGRYIMSHIKDGDEKETGLLGMGSVGLPAIIRTGRETGMEYFIVEQEHYAVMNPLESARSNALYMQDILG
jgi:sugar phosphate isomerase/epimerase